MAANHNSMKTKVGRPKGGGKGGVPKPHIGGMKTTGDVAVHGGIMHAKGTRASHTANHRMGHDGRKKK